MQPIILESAKSGKELTIDRFVITNNPGQIRGNLECSELAERPEDDEFLIRPFGIRIRLTNWEPKKPEFVVISCMSQS